MDTQMTDLPSNSSRAFWPLDGASDSEFKSLCHILWDWDLCIGCKNGQRCVSSQCPWKEKSPKLQPFFRFYQEITASYIPEMHTTSNYALRTHKDLFDIIQTLKQNRNTPRSSLTTELFARRGEKSQPYIADQNRAFDLAVRIMTTVCSSIENQPGYDTLVWHSDKTFQDFVGSIGGLKYHPALVSNDEWSPNPKEQLTAARLKKFAHLRFRGTDDLKNHLRLEERTVEIFYHTSFLKEHLRATRDGVNTQSLTDASSRGIIPRQLALETLDSLQKILFPFGDRGSHKSLESLTTSSCFDEDCLILPNSADCRRTTENNISYTFWGSRLRILLDELQNPSPHGLQELWERMSKPRHMMQAAVIGIMVAVLLGFMSLAIQILQVWISYQQLKYSTPTGTN